MYFLKQQWASAIAEASTAIADDPNNANAQGVAGFWKLFMGRGEDGFAGIENAFRLSPRDPFLGSWQFWTCHIHTHLAQWEKAIEWCSKAIAGDAIGQLPIDPANAASDSARAEKLIDEGVRSSGCRNWNARSVFRGQE